MSSVAPSTITHARTVPGADTLGGAVRLFLRFPTPRLLAAKLAVLLAARVVIGAPALGDALILLGVALYWPMQEWFLHKEILHFVPRAVLGVRLDPIFARYHRWHHENPWVLERTFLPTRVLVAVMPLNVLLFWLIMPTWGLALTGMAAMTCAAILYEWTHYLTHTPYRPRSAYYRRIHQNHMRHHFKDEARWFAFTAPWLDDALGTGEPPRGEAQGSQSP